VHSVNNRQTTHTHTVATLEHAERTWPNSAVFVSISTISCHSLSSSAAPSSTRTCRRQYESRHARLENSTSEEHFAAGVVSFAACCVPSALTPCKCAGCAFKSSFRSWWLPFEFTARFERCIEISDPSESSWNAVDANKARPIEAFGEISPFWNHTMMMQCVLVVGQPSSAT